MDLAVSFTSRKPALRLLSRFLQDVLADLPEHISLSTLAMAQCVSDFGTASTVDMQVCASCGTRDPDDPYSREVIRRLKCTSARLQPLILLLRTTTHAINYYVRQQCAHLDAALQRTPHLCALMIEYRREYKRISCTLILTARYTWRGGAPACFRTSSYLEVADGATPKDSSELLFFRGGREGEFLIHTSYIVLLSLSWGGVGLCGWIISGDSAHTSSLRRLHRRWISSR